jgi:hypothetical protein
MDDLAVYLIGVGVLSLFVIGTATADRPILKSLVINGYGMK